MRRLIAFIKLIIFALTLASYFVAAGVVFLVLKDKYQKRKMLARLIARYSRFTCFFMGIHVYPFGTIERTSNALLVGNHLSYLDIIVHASLRPSCFVTSVEIRDTPILGHICRLAACVFVERRSRSNLSKEIAEVTESLQNDINVTIFPEATSTNGESVLRFKRPLFQAAIDSKAPIIPMTINYERLDGVPVTTKNRDDICWYGDMDFFPHLWRVLNQHRIDVSVRYHGLLGANEDITTLAERSHTLVAQSFNSITESSNSDSFLQHGKENPKVANVDA